MRPRSADPDTDHVSFSRSRAPHSLYSKGVGEGVSGAIDETLCAAANDGHAPDSKEATVRAKWRNMRILRSRATSPEAEARRWSR